MIERDKEYYNQKISDLYAVIENQEKIIREYQEELQKADSITQSCIFEGKEENTINFRKCIKALENYKQRIDKAIKYATKEMRIVNDNEYHRLIEILKGGNND